VPAFEPQIRHGRPLGFVLRLRPDNGRTWEDELVEYTLEEVSELIYDRGPLTRDQLMRLDDWSFNTYCRTLESVIESHGRENYLEWVKDPESRFMRFVMMELLKVELGLDLDYVLGGEGVLEDPASGMFFQESRFRKDDAAPPT
jgi:hypothetical protein